VVAPGAFGLSAASSGPAGILRSNQLAGAPYLLPSAGFGPVAAVAPVAAAGAVIPSFDQAVIAALSVQNGVFDAGKGEQFGRQFAAAVTAYNEQIETYRKQKVNDELIARTVQMLSPQVLIKARIIQVNRSHLTDVGTVLDYISRDPRATNRPSFFTAANGMPKPTNTEIKSIFPVPIPMSGPGAVLQITSKHIDAMITAIQQDFRVDTLAAPSSPPQ